MVRLAHDEPSTPLKDREGTISTPFRKIFAIICLSPVFLSASVTIVEKDMGIVMDLAFWDGLSEMTFAQAIEMMIMKKAEPTDAAAASLGL
jgi:hypothetical protein